MKEIFSSMTTGSVSSLFPFTVSSIQALHPSEEHLKVNYITVLREAVQSEGSSDAPSSPCFWRTHRCDPS